MGYTEIMEIASDVLDYIGESYNPTYGDLVKIIDKLGDIVSCLGKHGYPLEDDDLID